MEGSGRERGGGGRDGPFDHERLDAYQTALQFLEWRTGILKRLPSKHFLVDQLDRASTSIAFNIAEGSGEKPGAERCRIYRISRRSATECSAILDIIEARKLEPKSRMAEGRQLIRRLIAMLTVLSRTNRPD